MVINVHIINFTLATAPVHDQLLNLDAVLNEHAGPIVVCGDFNTWKRKRLDILENWTREHRLEAVHLKEDHRSRYFGYPVDYVFYRELEVVDAACTPVTSSDHNPLTVTFRAHTAEESQQTAEAPASSGRRHP
jgi:endonuclease/exonuclease/phosphatase (EEP) superfamily protein YafD